MIQMKNKKFKKGRAAVGMRLKIFAYLAVFSAVILAVIWVFQAVLLDDVYRASVRRQVNRAADKICRMDDSSDEFDRKVYDIASEYGLCISVYSVKDMRASEIVSAHNQQVCLIHSSMLNEAFLGNLYTKASENGKYTENIQTDYSQSEGSIVLSSVSAKSDHEILCVVNCDIQPVGTTVSTLQFELIYISVILIAVAAAASLIIARRITRPVSAMNEEAKKLAGGNYDVNFTGGEYLETLQLADTLNYAALELSKLDTMQKELIANISHDLRTPLTMIAGYSEVMRDIPGEMSSENMQIIIDETHRLSSLVSDMLDLSRLTGGKRELHITRFSLTKCTSETVSRFAHLREAEGYDISFESDGDIYIEADETLILQVLYNLISNAINYTGEDKKVRVTMRTSDGMCRISVSDTGEGIPAEKLPLIWDRYYRAGDYHKRGIVGTGLGLSIAKNAIVLHGAPFGVTSTVGEGSTFWFEMKISEPQSGSDKAVNKA